MASQKNIKKYVCPKLLWKKILLVRFFKTLMPINEPLIIR